jgi:hypothetical protein
MTTPSSQQARGKGVSPKLLIVGHPRGGTSLMAAHLDSLGLRTVEDTRRHDDYPSGFMEHLPSLLFTKACERLRGRRDRLTDESLIREDFLEISCMRAMFEDAYAVFDEPGVDFIKLPDHALALDFMHQRFPHVRFLGVWRRPRAAIASFYRREFGRYPGARGLFYAIGTWNMYARRLIDFKTRHPDLIDIVGIDELVARNGSLSGMLRERGYRVTADRGIRDALRKEWRDSSGLVGTGLPLYEALFRRLLPPEQRVYFRSGLHARAIAELSL